jgi:hypothetical protein
MQLAWRRGRIERPRHLRAQLLGRGWLDTAHHHDRRRHPVPQPLVGRAEHRALGHGGMLGQHGFGDPRLDRQPAGAN